jgi:serine/threonine protein kinase
MVTAGGRVKVLDFGLAKRLAREGRPEVTTDASTLATAPGRVTGTLAYMSPEQLRGQPGSAASDVWALGVVLHEMAVGQRPFDGNTAFEVASAILGQRPHALPDTVPAALRAVVTRCLAKDPLQRYQNAGELGMQDGLITELARLRALDRVSERRSTRRFAGTTQTVPEIAAALGVDVCLDRLAGASGRSHADDGTAHRRHHRAPLEAQPPTPFSVWSLVAGAHRARQLRRGVQVARAPAPRTRSCRGFACIRRSGHFARTRVLPR